MPPQSSLPLRDGRVGLPPTTNAASSSPSSSDRVAGQHQQQQGQHQRLSSSNSSYNNNNEPFYTDEEIALLDQIVTLAESLLPTLPEQNRLPTEALFTAAEQVFPQHGFDPDHPPPHISRLIFKIGGQRSGETLSDKFRTILEGMGIKLDYVPTSPAAASAVPSNRSPASVAVRRAGNHRRMDTAVDDDDVDLHLFSHRAVPRRRHSSSASRPRSIARFSPGGRGQFDLPIRTAPGGSRRPRALSLSDYDSDVALEDALLRRGSAREGGAKSSRPEDKNRPEPALDANNRPTNPVLRAAHHALSRVTSEDYHPNEEEEDVLDDTTPDLPILPFQAHVPVMERARKQPTRIGLAHHVADLSEPEGRDVSTIGDTDHVHPSPHTEESDLHGASDIAGHPRHDEPYSPPYHGEGAADLEVLEGKLHQFRVQDGQKLIRRSLDQWRFNAVITRRDYASLEQRAADFDDLDMAAEVLEIWNDEAIRAQEEKVAAQVAAEHEAYVAKMERRAQRVYEILTVRNALAHWQDRALDEVDRTAVARRHLVRKRAFDGWRAQHIEDKTKVKNFLLIHALQKWGQIALHHEVRQQVAVQRYEKSLAQQVVGAMWEDTKGRAADEFRWTCLIEDCLGAWFTRTQEVLGEMEVAEAGDNRLVLCEVVDIWREEAEELHFRGYDGSVQLLGRDCLRCLEYWVEQARLKRLLQQYTTNQVSTSKHRVLSTWHAAGLQHMRQTLLADALLLERPISHWHRQAKLQIFYANQEYETKSKVITHWYLEEKLAWYKRHLDNETQLTTLNTLLSATRHVRSTRVRCQQEADYEYTYFTQVEVAETWLSAAESTWKPRHNANLILLYRTTMPVLEVWRKKHRISAANAARDRVTANIQANRFVLGGVLDRWPQLAERAKRERLMSTLREFRRNYKLELAEGCLLQWWDSTREVLDQEVRANVFLLGSKRSDVVGCIEYWNEMTYERRAFGAIAEIAEAEVWCGRWQGRMEEMEELRGVAVGFDADETVRYCWDRLEFQSLQRQGMGRSVAAVREKNDRRFCARVLEEWLDKALPAREGHETGVDPRFSALSRRSLRQREAAAAAAGNTSLFSGGYPAAARSTSAAPFDRGLYNDNRNVFTPAGSLIGGGGGGYAPLRDGRATATAHRAYTTGGGGNNNTFETPLPLQQQQSQLPLPSVSQLGVPTASGSIQQRPLPRKEAQQLQQLQSRRGLNRFGRSNSLLTATTPAPQPTPTPYGPLPMAEFDVDDRDDDSLLLSLTGREEAEGDDDDSDDDPLSLPPDLGFMSTPSRRLGRQGPGGRRQHLQRTLATTTTTTTTTPSAILATPHERELRRVYGQTQTGRGVGPAAAAASRGQGLGSQSVGPGLGSAPGISGAAASSGPRGPAWLQVGSGGGGLGQSLPLPLGGSRGGSSRERQRGGGGIMTPGSGSGPTTTTAGGGGRAMRVVEFADIREESAEL